MIPKVNFGVGEMGFMFCELLVSLKYTFTLDISSTNLPCLTSVLPGNRSDTWNSSFFLYLVRALLFFFLKKGKFWTVIIFFLGVFHAS